ncbi:MAG: hypothetical protein IT174_08570 [Acidobacteria bacterium]|nr:hypothetical protein [Acidobacteriota bacterium]
MEFEQKLEIAFGMLTFVVVIILAVIDSLPVIRLADYSKESINRSLLEGFIIFLIPAAILVFGSVIHAKGRSPYALIPIIAGGAFIVVVFTLASLHYAVFAGLKGAAIFGSPAVLSMITIFLAFRTRKSIAR